MSDFGPSWEADPPPGRGPLVTDPVFARLLSVSPPAPAVPQRWLLAGVLLVATFVTTTTMGAVWMLYTSTRTVTELPLMMLPRTVVQVWSDPALLHLGLAFSLPSLFILLCHELGHYLMCRRYRLPATVPYFLPLPLGVGTLGAFIKIKAPIRNKKELFDVGVAGPIAGFVALLPFLVLGTAWSQVVPLDQVAMPADQGGVLLVPGKSLIVAVLGRLVHGPVGPHEVLQIHPFALAAWLGLLATSLNLIPLGQLDGGHILYAALGRAQRRLALPLWLGLLAVAVLLWPGWLLWSAVTLIMGLRHPPVQDEARPLDPRRRRLAWAALAIFLLSFMPVPIGEYELVRETPAQRTIYARSRTKVTGPSLISSTAIRAPKRPVSTWNPALRRPSASASTSGSATSGGAAGSKDGRRPLASEAARVNWETTRNAAPAAAASRFILPSASAKTRSPESLPTAAST
jgi:hypothetical protein